jgi:hypothetical protein
MRVSSHGMPRVGLWDKVDWRINQPLVSPSEQRIATEQEEGKYLIISVCHRKGFSCPGEALSQHPTKGARVRTNAGNGWARETSSWAIAVPHICEQSLCRGTYGQRIPFQLITLARRGQ